MADAMKTEAAVEIIEVIDDDASAFIDRVTVHSANDLGGRRWIGPTATAALVSLIVYGVATSPSSNAIQDVAIATNATTLSSRFYIVDRTLDGYTMQGARSIPPDGASPSFRPAGSAELWATDGASAASGAWFVVSEGSDDVTGRNAYRTVAGEMELVIERDPVSGQTRLAFTKDNHDVGITAFGWADRQLQQLATSVSIDAAAIRYADRFFMTDHNRVIGADPAQAMVGLPVARVDYRSDDQPGRGFSITAADATTACSACTRFALINTSSFTVRDTTDAIIGNDATNPQVTVAQWRDGDYLITIRGELNSEAMMSIAQIVTPAADGKVQPPLPAGRTAAAVPSDHKTLGSGMLADGYRATVAVGHDANGALSWLVEQLDGSMEALASQATAGASIETLVEHGRTYVFAKAPRSTITRQLRVHRNGLPSVVIQLSDLGPAFTEVFASYVFVEPVPFNAAIVDGDDQTVASWPTVTG